MPTNSNSVTVTGNLTRDPELRFTPSGQATASFGVAVNRSWQNRQTQEWVEQTSFFDVTCWAQLAENAAQSLTRGTRVIVTGRLEQRSWETNGERRSKVEIIADEVAPSLRFATANITKNERRGPEGSYQGNGGGNYSSNPSNGGGNYQADNNYQGDNNYQANGGAYQGGNQAGQSYQGSEPRRPAPATAGPVGGGDEPTYSYEEEEPF